MSEGDPDLWDLISTADEALWGAGKWWNSEREIHVNVTGDMVAMPPGYSHLIGVNVDGSPQPIRGRNYKWHLNGPGSSECNWNCSVIDLGEHPTSQDLQRPARIGVSVSNPKDAGKDIMISGVDENGRTLLTTKTSPSDDLEMCGNTVDSAVYGVNIRSQGGKIIASNEEFGAITGIYKPETLGPVDVWAVYSDSQGCGTDHLATLMPEMRHSSIRRYQLPDSCSNKLAVHALVKVDAPQGIVSETQSLVCPSLRAIVFQVIADDYALNKMDVEQSEKYHALALRALDQHLAEKRGHTPDTIQVTGPGIADQNAPELYF
jgi:hypothetical protein